MKAHSNRQYTIRGISDRLDRALRKRAESEGKSMNTVLVESLHQAADQTAEPLEYHDLDDLIGQWGEDPDFDRCLAEQNRVDVEIWK